VNEPLERRVIAVAEARELDVFAALLERRGAQVLRYPLVRIIDAPDPLPVLGWIRSAAQGGLDDLILLTGEGLRRIMSCIDRHQPQLRTPFLAALRQMRKVTRGPKPARALRELGLASDLPAAVPTTAGVIDALHGVDLQRRRVGVQLYGAEPNLPLIDFLRAAGAQVATVAPYLYADGASDAEVRQLIERMCAGGIDAIAFTSKAQVERLFRAAPAEQVRTALAATNVAAIGPVVSETLASHGVAVDAMPQSAWFMKPLTASLSELLTGSTSRPLGDIEV
jgi:uroporphyrinogen-III synthase